MVGPAGCVIFATRFKGISMKNKAEKIFATLVRGSTYVLVGRNGAEDKKFVKGQPVEITAREQEWLRLHAVDRVSYPDMDSDTPGAVVGKDVQKFTYAGGEARQ
jgi:hypothetical protein